MIFCERIIKLILSKEVGLLISALIKTLREKKKKRNTNKIARKSTISEFIARYQ